MKTLFQPRQLLILLLAQAWVDPSSTCDQNQYWKDMKCCDKCPPGQKLVTKCTLESDTQCADCAAGEYQDTWNTDKHCQPFSYCDHNAGFLQRSTGTAEKDAVCECIPGKHCSSPQCETCVQHTPCAPSFGVVKEANNLIDTECEKCALGTFSNETSLTDRCHRWTSCDARSQEVKEFGSPFSDVTCGPKAEASRFLLPVFLPVVIVLCSLTVVVCYYFRDKVASMRIFSCFKKAQLKNPGAQLLEPQEHHVPNMPEELEQVNTENKPTQTAVEADEAADEALINGRPPVQESAGIQEVGKDCHLSEQEVL